MGNKRFDPRDLEYELYDPKRHRHIMTETEKHIAHLRAFHDLKDDDLITTAGFTNFSALVDCGWQAVGYASHLVDAPEGGYLYYWITDRHAAMIGRALRRSLRVLSLELTCLEGDGFSVLAEAVPAGVEVETLFIIHRSADEVTPTESRGLARLATKLKVRVLHLWAGEYEPGALEALAEELDNLQNRLIVELDICDTSKTEPEDRLEHPALSALVSRNRDAGG